MSIVKDGHKATLRKWHEELQAKRGNRASLRRSTTVIRGCLRSPIPGYFCNVSVRGMAKAARSAVV